MVVATIMVMIVMREASIMVINDYSYGQALTITVYRDHICSGYSYGRYYYYGHDHHERLLLWSLKTTVMFLQNLLPQNCFVLTAADLFVPAFFDNYVELSW